VRRDARHASLAAEGRSGAGDLEAKIEAKSAIDRFMETLSPSDRELFVLSEVDGLTGPELAATLGRKLPTLYSRVRILRRRFRASVDDAELEEARRERPSATAHGWMLLQPWLAAPSVAGIGGSTLIAGAMVATVAAAVTVGVVMSSDDDEVPASQPVAAQVSPPEPPAPKPDSRPPTSPRAPVAVPAAPEPPSPTAPEKVRKRAPRPAATKAKASVPDLAADTAMLQDANRALKGGRPHDALDLLKQHASKFPKPAQPDLRTALWVTALCDLNRPEQARRRAEALLQARPGTPVARRIAATCAGSKKPDPQP
jgi:hypothetical protein